MSQFWVFTQLGGSDRKQIILDGYAAPFGRARQKPVFETGKTLREKANRYPGNSGPPTRHLFGTNQEDFELTGRWMDKFLGAKRSLELVRQFEQFAEDQQQVSIAWGDFISYRGYVKSIQAKWESQTECVWTLKLLVDSNDAEGKAVQSFTPVPIKKFIDDAETWKKIAIPALTKSLPRLDALAGALFDTLDDALSVVGNLTSQAVQAAYAFDNFESATFAELQRLRSALHQLKTAALVVESTLDSISIDAALLDREASDDIEWLTSKNNFIVHQTVFLSSMSLMETQADLFERGQTVTSYTAKPGDSWEGIGVQVFNDASMADAIRQANGIKYGNKPEAGLIYQIPKR